MGVKEFAAKVGMASPNLLRTLNPRHNPTQDTLNRLLKPFRLKLSLAPSRIDRSAGTQRRHHEVHRFSSPCGEKFTHAPLDSSATNSPNAGHTTPAANTSATGSPKATNVLVPSVR